MIEKHRSVFWRAVAGRMRPAGRQLDNTGLNTRIFLWRIGVGVSDNAVQTYILQFVDICNI